MLLLTDPFTAAPQDGYGYGEAVVAARFIPGGVHRGQPVAGAIGVPTPTFAEWQVAGGVVGADWPRDVVARLIYGAMVVVVGFLLHRRAPVGLITALSRTWLRPLLRAASLAPPTVPTHVQAWVKQVLAGGGVR